MQTKAIHGNFGVQGWAVEHGVSRHQTEKQEGRKAESKSQSVLATMACCKAPVDSDPETQAASKQIDSQLRQDRRDEANRITLLLLGTNSFRELNYAQPLLCCCL